MKFIGVVSGTYENNPWAHFNFIEKVRDKPGCLGYQCVISKVSKRCWEAMKDDIELFIDQEVTVYYDQYGKIADMRLIDDIGHS